MAIMLESGKTLVGMASVQNKVSVTCSGTKSLRSHIGATVFWQTQLSTTATIVAVADPGLTVSITDIQVVNTDTSPQTFKLFVGGSTMANMVVPTMSLDAGGMAVLGANGWQVFDANGALKQATTGGGGTSGMTQAVHDALPGPHHAAFIQADHDSLPNPHHAAFTSTDHGNLPNPHHASFVAADHAALPNPHHVAFVQADHDLLANPHHPVLNLAAVAPPKTTPGAASAAGNGTNAARDNHSHQESGGVAARTAPTAAFNTTETQLVGFTVPANLLTVGSTFRLTANGICTSTVANAATFRCRIGSTTLTGNIACAIAPVGTTTASSAPFMVDMIVTVRSIGAGGTVIGNGVVKANSAAGALQAFTGFQTLSATVATVAVDTTASKIVELTAVTAAATTTLTVHNALLDWSLS